MRDYADGLVALALPSLYGLRAFEAAGRRLSFKLAARELHVTAGAVSQQIRALEASLGVTLFRRLTRSVELPRLGRFRALHPEIDVRISASTHLVDFARETVDVAIRRGLGRYPGLTSERLMSDEFFPVCAARLVRRRPGLRAPEDLRHHVLLHDESYQAWQTWLDFHGVRGVIATRGPIFDDASMALEAAIDGQGVALTRTALATTALRQRQLVKPFDLPMPDRFAYYVVCPKGTETLPKVRAFRRWLLEQAQLPRLGPF